MSAVEPGFCECGCGSLTRISRRSDSRWGHVKGQPLRFLHGHSRVPTHTNAERFAFLYEVDAQTECWVWQGSIDQSGYGKFRVWTSPGQWATTSPHRFAYQQSVGPIADGLQIDHLCRNPPCCNPRHLEAVTQQENRRRVIRDYRRTA